MIVINSEALNEFLINELKSRCNADPKSLTRYVMALLKKKRKETELRLCLLEALDIFLGKETISFVEMLLEALKSESYVSLPPKPNIPVDEETETQETEMVKIPPVNETKNEMLEDRHYIYALSKNRKLVKERRSPTGSLTQGSSNLSIVPPPMLSHERCKDYDILGYCMAGNSCSYFHGTDALVVEDVHDIGLPHDIIPPPLPPLPTQSFPIPPPLPPPEPPEPVYAPTHPVPEAYNPEHPGIETIPQTSYSFFNTRKRELVVLPTNAATSNKERQVKRKAYFDYNRLGPKPKCVKTDSLSNRDTHTLELKNVPPKVNNIVTLNSLFAKFGTIKNIEIGPTSIIRFEKPGEALVAFKNAPKYLDLYYDGKSFRSESSPQDPKKVFNIDNEPHTINKSISNERALSNKKLELLKKKQFLLNTRINYYKMLVEKITRVRSRPDSLTRNNKAEVKFLLETMESISNEIVKMKTEIKNESYALKKSLDPHSHTGKKPMMYNTKRENEIALLDLEMDYYHSKSLLRPCKKDISEEANKNLLCEVNELKEKAKWLGLFEKEPSFVNTSEPNSSELIERNCLSEEINLDTTNSLLSPSVPQQEQESTEQSVDISKSDSLLLGDDEEEDEEDSEARSWRR